VLYKEGDKNGTTALMIAARCGRLDNVVFLLEKEEAGKKKYFKFLNFTKFKIINF
jgi:ankyrin repeat protein